MHILLLEATDRLLANFPERLGDYTAKRLQKLGVEVRLRALVSKITPDHVQIKDGAKIPLETVIWTSGVHGEHINRELPTIRNGQVKVLSTFQTPDHPEVYVIGDLAFLEQDGDPLPMLAPVATQARGSSRPQHHPSDKRKIACAFSLSQPGYDGDHRSKCRYSPCGGMLLLAFQPGFYG